MNTVTGSIQYIGRRFERRMRCGPIYDRRPGGLGGDPDGYQKSFDVLPFVNLSLKPDNDIDCIIDPISRSSRCIARVVRRVFRFSGAQTLPRRP